MAINFKQVEDIRLLKSPLSDVICQVKFPPILSINNDSPIEYQNSVRSRFPLYEQGQAINFIIPSSGNADISLPEPPVKMHTFRSIDKKSFITLSSDSFAYSTSLYKHWNEFLKDFAIVDEATQKVYQPSIVTRLGLRFINRFTLDNTKSRSLDELYSLFKKELTCILKVDAWSRPIDLFSQLSLTDNDNTKLVIRFGTGKDNGVDLFILDIDCFDEDKQILPSDIFSKMETYHEKIYQAFRWCVLKESLKRFEPVQTG
ncbi:MAG: TIGR04255 family protein [Chloroflexi bacterium]|nr:TIGR04255 family protein [Chloroflexota bacterium]